MRWGYGGVVGGGSMIPLSVQPLHLNTPGEIAGDLMSLKQLMDMSRMRTAYVWDQDSAGNPVLNKQATLQNLTQVDPEFAARQQQNWQLQQHWGMEEAARTQQQNLQEQGLRLKAARAVMGMMKKATASPLLDLLRGGGTDRAKQSFSNNYNQLLNQLGIDHGTLQQQGLNVDPNSWEPGRAEAVANGQMDGELMQTALRLVDANPQLLRHPVLMTDEGEPVEGAGFTAPTGGTAGDFVQTGPGQQKPASVLDQMQAWEPGQPITPELAQGFKTLIATAKGVDPKIKVTGEQIVIPGIGVFNNPAYWQNEEHKLKLREKYHQGTGTTVNVGDFSPLGKAAQNKVQEGEIDVDKALLRLSNIRESYRPEFLQMPTQLWLGGLEWADKAGIKISDEQRQFLEAGTNFAQDAWDNFNRYVKEITGAQMSENEVNRLRRAIPDPAHDGPTVFKAKLDRSFTIMERAGELYKSLLAKGIPLQKVQRQVADQMLQDAQGRQAPKGAQPSTAPQLPTTPQSKQGPNPDPLGIR